MRATAESLHILGCQAQTEGDDAQAAACYAEALALSPNYPLAELALSQLRMRQTCFCEGREGYEARFAARKEGPDWRHLPVARWRGEMLAGKKLYLWTEQGFGDVLMFAGFLPALLAQRPARIVLGMFPKMLPLFARSFPQMMVEPLEDAAKHALAPTVLEAFPRLLKLAEQSSAMVSLEPLRQDYERALACGAFDYAAPMGDLLVYGLPHIVPAKHQAAYITADPQRVKATKTSLAALGPGRKIGISWHTDDPHDGTLRSIPLEQWRPILAIPGYHFFSLQHHVPQEVERFCAENAYWIHTPPFDPLQDTEGLAALTACMDEVISIDNSNAHLAGALGVPTTLLLPTACNFRWPVLEHGMDTLWYRSVKVERQAVLGEWQPVIGRVAERIRGQVEI